MTHTCATIIDIFTNDVENTIQSRLLINDISDHLPVFIIYQLKKNKEVYWPKYVRLRTDETINKFWNDHLEEDWIRVYVEDVNVAYDTFLKTYIITV